MLFNPKKYPFTNLHLTSFKFRPKLILEIDSRNQSIVFISILSGNFSRNFFLSCFNQFYIQNQRTYDHRYSSLSDCVRPGGVSCGIGRVMDHEFESRQDIGWLLFNIKVYKGRKKSVWRLRAII
jgi:hypothetical protein